MNTCQFCGCTDDRACPGGCFWVAPDFCSRCAVSHLIAEGISSPLIDFHDQIWDQASPVKQHDQQHEALPRLWRPGDPI